jgi:Uma2 family endonuclease
MPRPLPKPKKAYSYRDYASWPDEERWELFEGEPVAMTPGPTVDHQRVSRRLCFLIESFLQGKSCEMFDAPFDVLLPSGEEPDEEVKTVLQPDILVVCDPAKVTKQGLRGAPDFVIEIISPSTASRDHIRKRQLYEKHGVKEFWLIDPVGRLVTVYRRARAGSSPSESSPGPTGNPNGSPAPSDGSAHRQPGAPPATRIRKGNTAKSTLSPFEIIGIMGVDDLHLEVKALPGLTIDFSQVFPPEPKGVRESPRPYARR